MRWNGRTVLALVLVSMMASSLFTMAFLKGSTPAASLLTVGASSSQDYPQEFSKLYEAFEIIKREYIQNVPNDKLVEGAIDGMIKTLDDPYTDYMSPEAAEQFNESLDSTFQGIGAEVTMQNGRVTIVSPFKGSPAEKAGLKPNDQILSVNGESLEGLDLYQAVQKIRGPKGSKAVLKVLRSGVEEPLTIVCIRDEIPIETVYSEVITQDGMKFGKIEITQFSAETAKHFAEQLDKLEKQGIKGLVIDVRGNPGGYLLAVKEIGQLLIPHQGTIVKIVYGDNAKGEEEIRSTLDKAKPYPIVMLVDNGSASASEILAGAMRDSGGYKLVGEKTFGKGTVQNTVEMKDKSQIKLTIAKWLTPKGEWIHKKGIEPDYKVDQPAFFKAAPLPQDKVLQRDMAGAEVKNLQVILEGLGLGPGRSDGYFDARTEDAVKRFQAGKKLPVTGKVDQKTAAAIQEAILAEIRNQKNDKQLQKALQVLEEQAKAK
ncbi:PDZ domain-containing protein [Brevibacillus sp. SYP-B805]|uniref:S41 family peptidase n=1 Tax=Brevibacillus sp. SYP-B805 TaxID=1578199 RepID=UPI0013EB83C3|nr:S41 family peptidase [Brevibacillus sp. SYP-B805]NGQ95683.1 PDZ domain-containing protein [Brevibacillus sp. SYP-B805]